MRKSYCGIRFYGFGGIFGGWGGSERARGKFMKLCGCRSFGLGWVGLGWLDGWMGKRK